MAAGGGDWQRLVAAASGIHHFEAGGGFVQIGIPAMSTTGYSMKGC